MCVRKAYKAALQGPKTFLFQVTKAHVFFQISFHEIPEPRQTSLWTRRGEYSSFLLFRKPPDRPETKVSLDLSRDKCCASAI